MSWQPAPESLSQLAACLKDSLSGFDKTAQKQAEQVSSNLKETPLPVLWDSMLTGVLGDSDASAS
jgi:hypothetical protein